MQNIINMSCQICSEDIRKTITCPFCEFSACKNCNVKYILDPDRDKNASCMSCNREWTKDVLINIFSKNWVEKKYSGHVTERNFKKEMSLMPATQPIAEIHVKKINLKKQIDILRKQLSDLQSNSTSPKKENLLKCPCPNKDCRGFVSVDWKCGICDSRVCAKCHNLKPKRGKKSDPDRKPKHKCDENDLLSVELLNKDTKPCPTCACLIFKIEGCDQIWCVKCHTAFSWKTGRIDKGVVHNPHYYEMLRKLGGGVAPRNIGDVVCGGLPPFFELQRQFETFKMSKELSNLVSKMHRLVSHIMNYIMVDVFPPDNGIESNVDLRIKYMSNEIDEKKFKSDIKRRFKRKELNHEIRQVYDMFTNTMINLFGNMIVGKTIFDVNVEFENIEKLRKYTNLEINKISNIYKNRISPIAEDWTIY